MAKPDVHKLAAEYAESKQTTADEVTRRRAIVAKMRTVATRDEVAALLHMTPQRVSEIVGEAGGIARHLGHAEPAETMERYGR